MIKTRKIDFWIQEKLFRLYIWKQEQFYLSRKKSYLDISQLKIVVLISSKMKIRILRLIMQIIISNFCLGNWIIIEFYFRITSRLLWKINILFPSNNSKLMRLLHIRLWWIKKESKSRMLFIPVLIHVGRSRDKIISREDFWLPMIFFELKI